MEYELRKKRVAVLGAGKMGGILLHALLKNNLLSAELTCATVRHEERAKALATKLNIKVGTDNAAAAKGADIILIAVKPQIVQEVLREIRGQVTPGQLIISVAAAVHDVGDRELPSRKYSRHPRHAEHAMFGRQWNDGAVQRQICGRCSRCYDLSDVDQVGRTVVVDEKYMDAVTGLSGSGPAYIYIILESLAEAGVKVRTSPRCRHTARRPNHAWSREGYA